MTSSRDRTRSPHVGPRSVVSENTPYIVDDLLDARDPPAQARADRICAQGACVHPGAPRSGTELVPASLQWLWGTMRGFAAGCAHDTLRHHVPRAHLRLDRVRAGPPGDARLTFRAGRSPLRARLMYLGGSGQLDRCHRIATMAPRAHGACTHRRRLAPTREFRPRISPRRSESPAWSGAPGPLRSASPGPLRSRTRRRSVMSFVSPDPGTGVAGVAVSTVGSVSAGGPAVAGVHGADVLAFTGAVAGDPVLAIIGFSTLSCRRRRDVLRPQAVCRQGAGAGGAAAPGHRATRRGAWRLSRRSASETEGGVGPGSGQASHNASFPCDAVARPTTSHGRWHCHLEMALEVCVAQRGEDRPRRQEHGTADCRRRGRGTRLPTRWCPAVAPDRDDCCCETEEGGHDEGEPPAPNPPTAPVWSTDRVGDDGQARSVAIRRHDEHGADRVAGAWSRGSATTAMPIALA